jgi:hypothetical protein
VRLVREAWERSDLATEHGLDWSSVPHGRKRLDYLPWQLFERDQVRTALPSVAILNVIATSTVRAPTLVIHQGLLLHTQDGEQIVRHASSTRGRVVEETIDVFLARSHARRHGKALGVNVLAIVDD